MLSAQSLILYSTRFDSRGRQRLTAAAACLASSLLMPKDVTNVGLVGGSVQAIWHLRFLAAIVTTRRCVVRTRSQASAAAFRDKMRASPCALDREWSITTYEEERERGAE